MILQELQEIIIAESVVNFLLNMARKIANYFGINLKQFTNPDAIKNFVNVNRAKLQVAKQLYNKVRMKKESELYEGMISDFMGQDKVVIILVIFMFIIGVINPDAAMNVKDFFDYAKDIAEKLNF